MSRGRSCRGLSQVFACAIMFAGSLTANAEEKPQSISFISGTCEALRIPGDDLTARCLPQLIATVYPDGRSEFGAQAGDDRIVLLRMAPSRADSDAATHALVSIAAVNPQSGDVKDRDVTGSCRDTQPPAARRSILCAATDQKGDRYELRFVSDGRPPMITRF